MQDGTRYFHVSYFFSRSIRDNSNSGHGETTIYCVGMFSRIDIVKAIESNYGLTSVIITGWQEMSEADYYRFIEVPTA